ncbi:hypothetical protein [Vibrio parahaemolyticus]|uniref:hypothetical protein n=1 Tax=Vibrio parahaemolyticus TaxID=670 RepID=UPI00235DE2C1|nr:hypothetical protein [Vibrio parahaemolyticus]
MDFILSEKVIVPFIATIGASLTIIFLQFYARRIKETKQKIYAATYMSDVAMRITQSELIILRHTIIPHIKAVEKMLAGDEELLKQTFISNEFDILTAPPLEYNHLPNEYSLEVGYDNMQLVQMYEVLLYTHKNDTNQRSLNAFVKDNLKSIRTFASKSDEERKDILCTYYDYLKSLEHESNRMLHFTTYRFFPELKQYLKSYRFWLYSIKGGKNTILSAMRSLNENSDLVPDYDYMEKVRHGGIQHEL